MSLITRCPACLTTFRVVPDQLRISQGWVRCGQCEQVFDANAALVDGVAESPKAAIAEDPPEYPEPVQRAEPDGPPERDEPLPQASPDAAPDPSLGFPANDAVAVDVPTPPVPEPEPEPADVPAEVDVDLGASSDAVAVAVADPEVQPAAEATPPPAPPPPQKPVEPSHQDLSFMRPMPGKSPWQRTSVRVFLALLAIGLLAALGIQGAVHERDRIAAMFPQTKPALQWVCRQLNCTVSNLRQIESVVIDSSSFNKIRPDAYRLSIVLRNTSALDVAMPALELTLTDSQDQPVMRRVLLANEYSPVSALGAAGDWTGAVAITIRGNGSDRFSGYKVLAFYP